ncbi:hypothetical protein [Nocardia cyriacigeorgica]|uniref:hypothetical protein n=1 Tax=Nocardia cyriacigeorgica TaxID=135487 RepID=UPI0024587E32|nr:hypothetical protein [Nocardia cyriacigeorgica]
MDPVTSIAAAVAAGAAAGITDVANRVIAESYQGLKELLTRRHGVVEAEIVSVERDPEESMRRELLARELSSSSAGEDPEVLAASRELLHMIAEEAPTAAESVGVRLTRVDAGWDIEITGPVVATDVRAGGSIRINTLRIEEVDSQGPSTARG